MLSNEKLRTFDVADLKSPATLWLPARRWNRELRELRRRQSAAEAIEGLTAGVEIYGFTKGQFSMLDLIVALLELTGPADVCLSTWTAARHEIKTLDELSSGGRILSMRWLVDFTFSRRDPQAANQIRLTFGLDAIRVCQTHAKFCLFGNDGWQIVLRTSMNLNMNPRFEDFTIAHDPELYAFLATILKEIWTRQSRKLAAAPAAEIRRHFTEDM